MSDPLLSTFDQLVARAPQAPILLAPGRPALAREALGHLAEIAAQCLPSLEPGAIVGLRAAPGSAFPAGFLALLRRGVAVLLFDPQTPEESWRRTASALGARGLLACAQPWPERDRDWLFEELKGSRQVGRNTAVLKLTSGSTGEPRAVAVSSDALLADEASLSVSMGLLATDRTLAAIPMSHSYGFGSVVLPALVRGAAIVVPDGAGPLSPLHAATTCGATVFPTAPAYLQALLRMSQPPAWPESVRLVLSAGARLMPETAVRFREVYRQPVHVFYGASECGGICYDREGGAAERGTVGTPVEGVRVELEPLPDWPPGEGLVTIASAAVATTYLPHSHGSLRAGCFRTSDIAGWSGGELKLLGRIDGLINVKGKKVDPAELEGVLEELPGVDEVVALAIPAPEAGGEMVRVVIACQPGSLAYADVIAWCRSRLAEHKLPRSVVLVPELPRTARGKLDRLALASLRPPDA